MHSLLRCLRYDWPLHFVLLLTNWLPDNVIFLRIRGWLAHWFVRKSGDDLRLARNITFYNPSSISLGSHVYIAYGCVLLCVENIFIDDEVMLGPYCVVVSGNHVRYAGSFRYGPDQLIPIRIGAGAWLGAHVVVTAGAQIGQGTLIAAGAVVNGEIPSDCMAGGMPARIIKELCDS
jgi:acetyltransferase-like isoleucine patch superfamily enzyme